MALFKPYKIQSSQLNSLPKKEGQLIVTTDDKALYIDISNSQRIKVYSDELARIDSLEGIEFAIVESLPTENINEDYIYLIESDSDEVTPSSNITYTISKTGDTITLTGSNNTTSTVSIDNKVDKIDGKGLSTKDFSAAYETKLQGIAEGADVNSIETIQLNGTTITPSNKVVNIQVNNLSTQDVQDLIDASITNALEASY